MNHSTYINDSSSDTIRHVLRAASGIGIACIALAGHWSHPWALFALSGLSVYLTCSAIIGKGLWDAFFKSDTDETGTNVARAERAGRGVTAGVAMGTVLSGALLLDPVDVFVLMLVGVYTGLSALTGWDPVRALFGGRAEAANDRLTRAIPAAVGHTGLGGTGRTADKRAA